ncbi:MAG: hypothetical protein CL938_11810 [Deltaproteobacteria bacterium]|jgi:hypothetical protein|nr:hypothetical protein [Deltaproteobacteria bacterium]
MRQRWIAGWDSERSGALLKLACRRPKRNEVASQERSERASSGTALPVEAFAEDALRLDAAAFAAVHGTGFLMVMAAAVSGSESNSTRLLLDGADEEPDARTVELSVVIYPLCPRKEQAGHLVTVGRDARHDVVIPDPSVSRFHAVAKRNEDGTCLIQDMGSTNGTTVNGTSVAARGIGEPTPVKPGDTIRFGQVKFTFSDARALREFVLQATS